MVTFLFWNINRRPRERTIANLARRHKVDVLMLAECRIPKARLSGVLNKGNRRAYDVSVGPGELTLSVLAPATSAKLRDDIPGLAVRNIRLPGGLEIILAVIHLGSKLWESAEDQGFECTRIADVLREEEARAGHNRTLLVGDLNMDPFEPGVVSASGLHAVMSRDIALRGARIVKGKSYPFFYNPMWGRLGDSTPGPPGTYYYSTASHVSYFWHTFDQVLLRPSLLSGFRTEALRVLTNDGRRRFYRNGKRPDPTVASDHFPLLFSLDL